MKVKQLLILVALIAVILGCTNNPKVKFEKITYQSKVFLEHNLIEYLNKSIGLHSEDSLKFANALDSFQRHIKGLSNDIDFLERFPLQATNIRDTVMGTRSFKMATFESYTDLLRDKGSIMNRMKLRINGIFEFPDQANGLVLGGKYYLTAMMYKQGKRADINYDRKSNPPIYVLGVYPMAVKEIVPVFTQKKPDKLN